jgi:hypothetical protein
VILNAHTLDQISSVSRIYSFSGLSRDKKSQWRH